MVLKNVIRSTAAVALMSATVATPALAQDDAAPGFSLQLNTAAETEAGGCLLTYVAVNRTGQDLAAVSYEVGVFDTQDIVTTLLVLEFGDIIDGKTKIVQFDLGGLPCADISRITVNVVTACDLAEGGVGDFCMSSLETSSRAAIQFGI